MAADRSGKKRILTAHVFGVDIDPQAVEVTKLSLLLKVLEGENAESVGQTMRLFHERALPDLSSNIRCGNSLIGLDYSNGKLISHPDELKRVNPFDWREGFPEATGGFDCVIGNPPYGSLFSDDEKRYLEQHYSTFVWRGESYMAFVEKAHSLLADGGAFGFIIPDTYLNLGFTQALRQFLLQSTAMDEIVVLPSDVFADAVVDTTLIFTRKKVPSSALEVRVTIFPRKMGRDGLGTPLRQFQVPASESAQAGIFLVQAQLADLKILRKMEFKGESRRQTIRDVSVISYGIKVYQVGKGDPPQSKAVRDEKPFTSSSRQNQKFLPFYDGKHIGRYQLLWTGENWLKYGRWVAEPRSPELFEGEKLLIRKIIGRTLIATYTPDTSYCNTCSMFLSGRPASTGITVTFWAFSIRVCLAGTFARSSR